MPATPSIELRRHVHTLSEKETDEVVDVMADLIVSFLKSGRMEQSVRCAQEQIHG